MTRVALFFAIFVYLGMPLFALVAMLIAALLV